MLLSLSFRRWQRRRRIGRSEGSGGRRYFGVVLTALFSVLSVLDVAVVFQVARSARLAVVVVNPRSRRSFNAESSNNWRKGELSHSDDRLITDDSRGDTGRDFDGAILVAITKGLVADLCSKVLEYFAAPETVVAPVWRDGVCSLKSS